MNIDDIALFQQAQRLANTGQRQAAYDLLCNVRSRGNNDDPDLLLWIAFATPYQQEAQQALETVSSIAPDHPGLANARMHYAQQWQPQAQSYQQGYAQSYQQGYGQSYQQQQYAPPQQQYGPSYGQPYMQSYVPLGPPMHCPYCHTYAPVRIEKKISTVGWVVFVILLFLFLILCWIGLLIKEEYRVCSNCGMKLG